MNAAQTLNVYRCHKCARELQASSWMGRCPSCSAINSMRLIDIADWPKQPEPAPRVKRTPPPPRARRDWPQAVPFAPRIEVGRDDRDQDRDRDDSGLPVDDVPEDIFDLPSDTIERLPCGIRSVDDVFGVGLPVCGAIMFAGAPGAGKSRLTMEIAARRASLGRRSLIISGEEQKGMIGARAAELQLAQRFQIPKGMLQVYLTNDLDRALDRIDDCDAEDVYVDAMNVLKSRALRTRSEQLLLVHISRILHERAWASVGSEYEGKRPVMIWAICHGTKDGDMAGPEKAKHLFDAAHMIDHVLPNGEPAPDQRRSTGFIRIGCIAKNRFGASDVSRFMHMSKPSGILVPYDPPGKD